MLEFYQGHGKPHDIRILFFYEQVIYAYALYRIYAWMICGAKLSLINISIIHTLYANYTLYMFD